MVDNYIVEEGSKKPLWKLANYGRPRIINTPEELGEKAKEYFEWVDNNPILEPKLVNEHGFSVEKDLQKLRPMTVSGLCVFLGIARTTWYDWSKSTHDFSNIISIINEIMTEQKFSGATAGVFNANIIARDLGLVDKSDLTTGGDKVNTINQVVLNSLTDKQIEEALEKTTPIKED